MRGVRVVYLSLKPARFSYFLRQGAAVAFSRSTCYCEWRGVWAVLRLRSSVFQGNSVHISRRTSDSFEITLGQKLLT
jgi:hypothetical protein